MLKRYQCPKVQEIFQEETKFQYWFDVEVAYLKSYFSFYKKNDDGLIDRLKKAKKTIEWSGFVQKVFKHDQIVHHDVIAFLTALESELNDDSRLIHLGLTSSDIVDTAFALQLKNSGEIVLENLRSLIKNLFSCAQKHKGQICLGRTHGQSAEPTSFGLKILGHACEFKRWEKRLELALSEIAVGKLSGAVGVYAHTHPEIERLALKELGLVPESVATQIVARDRHANFFSTLAGMGGSIERLAVEIRLLMHGEIKEAFEPFGKMQKGSSAMPHKKNPVLSENLTGISRLLRSYALSAFENQALWHERDISHSSVERVIGPDATNLAGFALERLNKIVCGLEVDSCRLEENLRKASDTLFSQGVLLALVEGGMLRQDAYKITQSAALKKSTANQSFREALIEQGINQFLSEEKLEEIFKVSYHLRFEEQIFSRAREEMQLK